MNPDELGERIKNLTRRQYGELWERLVTAPADSLVAIPEASESAAAAAGDQIRRRLLAVADRLVAALGRWRTYHLAAADLPEPARTAWLLGEYLGLDAAECERLTEMSAAEFEASRLDAERLLREALAGNTAASLPEIDEAWLRQELLTITEKVWSPEFGILRPAMVALVRDAVRWRAFGGTHLDPSTRRAFCLAFGRLYREFRQGNCQGILGGSFKRARHWQPDAQKELDWLIGSNDARQELKEADPFAETCFALMRDVCLGPKVVAELVRATPALADEATPALVEQAAERYEKAIRRWIADRRKDTGAE